MNRRRTSISIPFPPSPHQPPSPKRRERSYSSRSQSRSLSRSISPPRSPLSPSSDPMKGFTASSDRYIPPGYVDDRKYYNQNKNNDGRY